MKGVLVVLFMEEWHSTQVMSKTGESPRPRGPAVQREHDREEGEHSTRVGNSPRGPAGVECMTNMAIIMLWCNDA